MVVHINVQCIKNKINELHLLLHDNPFIDILLISEHWLRESEELCFPITNFNMSSCFCRGNAKNGGVCIYTGKNYTRVVEVAELKRLSIERNIEIAACFISDINLLVVCIYRPPNSDINIFFSTFHNLLIWSSKFKKNVNMLIGGDFNIDLFVSDNNKHMLMDMVHSFGLQQTIYTATRVQNGTSSCLDNIFVNFELPSVGLSLDSGISDHFHQLIEISFSKTDADTDPVVQKRVYTSNKLNTMNNCLSGETWTDVYLHNSGEDKFNVFFDTFMYYFKNCFFSTISKQVKTHVTPWITPEIKRSKDLNMFFYEHYRQTPTESNRNIYREYKKIYRRQLLQAKENYYANKIQTSDNISKSVWGIINYETGRNKVKNWPENVDPDQFNNFFTSNADNILQGLPVASTSPLSLLENTGCENSASLFIRPVTPEDIRLIIKSMKNKKTEDVYGINPSVVRSCSQFITEPLADAINLCISDGHFPSKLKVAKVLPIYKKGNKNEIKNYRPISILPTFSKIFEMVLCQSLVSFLNQYSIITPCQFGFRGGLTTTDAINQLTDYVYDSFECGDACGGLLTDLSSAFDSVDHSLLLDKLQHYGIRGTCLQLFRSYLEGRFQRVHMSNRFSSYQSVTRGVPQGSILGPILFLIYVNDLPGAISVDRSITILYADDTSFLFRSSDSQRLVSIGQTILEEARVWFTANHLFLNESKTTTLDFCLRGGIQGGNPKFLGVCLDASLGWKEQIGSLCDRLSSSTYAIRKIRCTAGQRAALVTYFGLFHSVMTYGILAWGNAANVHLQRVFMKQKNAVRVIANIKSTDSCKPFFARFKINTLYGNIIYENLCHIRKHRSTYHCHMDIHQHDTRFKYNIAEPNSRLRKVNHYDIDLYNLLPLTFREFSFNKFKKYLKKYLIGLAPYSLDEFKTAMRENRDWHMLM